MLHHDALLILATCVCNSGLLQQAWWGRPQELWRLLRVEGLQSTSAKTGLIKIGNVGGWSPQEVNSEACIGSGIGVGSL